MSEYEPINVVLAVSETRDALVVGYGPTSHPQDYWFDEGAPYAVDNGFENLPIEPGLYNCRTQPYWLGHEGDPEGEMRFMVLSSEKIASITNGVASEEGAAKAQLMETINATHEVVEGLKRERDEALATALACRAREEMKTEELNGWASFVSNAMGVVREEHKQLRRQLTEANELLSEVRAELFGDEAPADWRAEVQAMKKAQAALEIADEEDGVTWLAAVAWAKHDELARLRAEMALRESQWQEAVAAMHEAMEQVKRERDEAERIREERDALRASLANCRGYLGSLAEDWDEMPDNWMAGGAGAG